MPHRGLHNLNNILHSANDINDFYQKKYLFPVGDCSNVEPVVLSQPNAFYRLSGYDHYGTDAENKETVHSLTTQMIGSIRSSGRYLSYTILSEETGIRVYYGTYWQNAEIIKKSLSNVLQKANVSNDWIHSDILKEFQRYGAFLVGSEAAFPPRIDQILASLDGKRFMFSVFARPISLDEIKEEDERIRFLSENLQKVEHTETSYGAQRRRTSTNRNLDVSNALDTLGAVKQRLDIGIQTGLWETVIYVSAPTSFERDNCAQMLSTLFSGSLDDHSIGSPTSIILCATVFVEQGRWYIPGVRLFNNPLPGLYRRSLVNILTTDDLASVISPPEKEHRGYAIRHMGDSAKMISPFSPFPPISDGSQTIRLGRLDTHELFSIQIEDLRRHVLVTGATQYGKTTTVKKLLIGAMEAGIPFLVIEAAKKDYWRLKKYTGMQQLRVYSGGCDGLPLRINPFQPEVGTKLEYHIQGLITVFLSLFDEEDPVPKIIQKMVYMAYEKLGWNTSTRITGVEERPYPTISDMLINLDECINAIGYDETIKQRMYGVMNLRMESLLRAAGESFNTTKNISSAELLQTSSIIELDDYSSDTLPFVASLLALKVREHSRTQPLQAKLRCLVVLEEAHNILPNPELPNASKNRAVCAEFFTNMLAEVSGYGTGVIVVDQRPSIISSGAIANTGLKIVHRLRQNDDIKTVAPSLSFSESIKNALPNLKIGEAIVALPNETSLYTMSIMPLPDIDEEKHLGCLFCEKKQCQNYRGMITLYEQNRIRANGISVTSLKSCIASISHRQDCTFSNDDTMCLAGNLCKLAGFGEDFEQGQRHILYDLYYTLHDEVGA